MSRNLHPAAELAAYKTGLAKGSHRVDQEDKYLRLAAEFDNYKKRTARQFADLVKNANEELILDILAVLDDFDRALQTMSDDKGDTQPATANGLLSGMGLIYDKLMNVLKGRGVSQFDPIEQPFDPQYHDAVMQMPSDKEEGTVIGVISPGYTMNDKVIRHAKVVVASSK
jgi:molecular chaperone GrpE